MERKLDDVEGIPDKAKVVEQEQELDLCAESSKKQARKSTELEENEKDAVERMLIKEGFIDSNFLELKKDMGDEFIVEVIELYMVEGEEMLSSLEKLTGKESIDFRAVRELVHKFKGSSLNIGAMAICEKCTQMRKLCLDEAQEDVKSAQDALQKLFVTTQVNLKRYLGSDGKKQKTLH